MMWRTARFAVVILAMAVPAHAQTWASDGPGTADAEEWYVSGEPLLLDGHVYYPAGPIQHFNAREMVRSGYVGVVPVYVRTTYEPRSIVFVPLTGGLVKPYERRRDGELAGTVGSTAPSFPVTLPAAAAPRRAPPLRAPGPPTGHPVGMWGAPAVGDRGTSAVAAAPLPLQATGSAAGVLSTARAPEGLNAAFVEFDDQRWFLSGRAVPFDAGRFEPAGEYFGFTVYLDPARPRTIFVPVVDGEPGLLTPYRAR